MPIRATTGLPLAAAADHASLALMPFSLALTDPKKNQGPTTFSCELLIDGRLHQAHVTLQPGESGELPVHGDQMVYLALLQLALRAPSPDPVLHFHRNEATHPSQPTCDEMPPPTSGDTLGGCPRRGNLPITNLDFSRAQGEARRTTAAEHAHHHGLLNMAADWSKLLGIQLVKLNMLVPAFTE